MNAFLGYVILCLPFVLAGVFFRFALTAFGRGYHQLVDEDESSDKHFDRCGWWFMAMFLAFVLGAVNLILFVSR